MAERRKGLLIVAAFVVLGWGLAFYAGVRWERRRIASNMADAGIRWVSEAWGMAEGGGR